MKNIFSQRKDYVQGQKRNTFDLSFQNNLTMKFGRLYPVFFKEVVPGDSFRINPTFGLRFMPLVFPVQTRMQANLHFFYVRNRTLWKDWMDFIGRTKDGLVHPFLSAANAKRLFKTGALGDYIGVPTTLVGRYGSQISFSQQELYYGSYNQSQETDLYHRWYLGETADRVGDSLRYIKTFNATGAQVVYRTDQGIISPKLSAVDLITDEDGNSFVTINLTCTIHPGQNLYMRRGLLLPSSADNDDWRLLAREVNGKLTISTPESDAPVPGDSYDVSLTYDGGSTSGIGHLDVHNVDLVSASYYSCQCSLVLKVNVLPFKIYNDYTSNTDMVSKSGFLTAPEVQKFMSDNFGNTDFRFVFYEYSGDYPEGYASNYIYSSFANMRLQYLLDDNRDISRIGDELNPYATGDIHVSALPFRAYEAIYNAYYRNQQNDPFKINNVPEYNKYVTTDAGGLDNTVYDFFNRNWELDFLTSATQTPQQGDITPLVGVSAAGDFTFQNPDGTTTVVHPTIGSDGTTLTGISAYEGATPADGSLPAGVRRLTELIPYGISINDFRNVNALQRWLETNLRRGYKYRDQIKSHFDVDVHYNELDMPEFIGGMSEPVIVNQINQSVDQTESGYGSFEKVLGSYAGQASILAQSEHDITHYADEHGFIIGIMSISPVPNYSQLLPKHLIKDNVLDYYFPEFGHIGNQPITYREVCPLQSFVNGDSLDDVFGYQRAWYDMIASVDEVHGEFRTSLRDFLINRVFDSRPELGHDFLEVSEDQINDVFSVTDQSDKILGQIYFKVTAQRPIPKFGIPRLE